MLTHFLNPITWNIHVHTTNTYSRVNQLVHPNAYKCKYWVLLDSIILPSITLYPHTVIIIKSCTFPID